MEKENLKYIALEVTPYICQKVKGIIKPGDYIIVSHKKTDIPLRDDFVLISSNEHQWIEKYWPGLKKRYRNIYKIIKIIMNN